MLSVLRAFGDGCVLFLLQSKPPSAHPADSDKDRSAL